MEWHCRYCNKLVKKLEAVFIKEFPEHKRKQFYESSEDLFGKDIIPLVTCKDCNSSIQMHTKCNDFRQKIIDTHPKLNNMMKDVKEYIDSINESLTIENINGILMIIPHSRKDDIAAFKFLKEKYSPKVSLFNLPIIFQPDDDEYESETEVTEKKSPVIKIEAVQSILESIYNNSDDASEVNINESNSSSMETSNVSSEEIEVFPCKLEPAIEIQDESIENVEMMENIEQLSSNFKCTKCSKKMKTKILAMRHVAICQLKEIARRKSLITNEEEHFIKQQLKFLENDTKSGKNLLKKKTQCQICQSKYGSYYVARKHVLMKHMNKSLKDFDARTNKKILVEKGTRDCGQLFLCTICHENDNPIQFKKKSLLELHLNEHTGTEKRLHVNDDKIEIDDTDFDHILSMAID